MKNKNLKFILLISFLFMIVITPAVHASIFDVNLGEVGNSISETLGKIKAFFLSIYIGMLTATFFILIGLFFVLLALWIIIPLRFYDALVKFKDVIKGYVSFASFNGTEGANQYKKGRQ